MILKMIIFLFVLSVCMVFVVITSICLAFKIENKLLKFVFLIKEIM